MKIGHTNDKPVPAPAASNGTPATTEAAKSSAAAAAAATASAATAAAAKTAIPAKADASAKIAISTEATNLLDNHGHADFDAEKVSRISNEIAKGTFKINPGAIADKLISNAKEVLTKT